MDPNWKDEKRPAKNYLAKNSDEGAGGVGSNMGCSTASAAPHVRPESSGQGGLARFDLGPYVPAGVKSLST